MLNKVILLGNIGRTPRIYLTQDGREIATFFLATTTKSKDPTGEWQSCTDWHRITVFREATVQWVKDILKKGDTLYVEGKLTYSQKKDKYGQIHFKPHVVIAGREGRIQHIRSSSGLAEREPAPFASYCEILLPESPESNIPAFENSDQDVRFKGETPLTQSQPESSSCEA